MIKFSFNILKHHAATIQQNNAQPLQRLSAVQEIIRSYCKLEILAASAV
jgi:hypothetical protein